MLTLGRATLRRSGRRTRRHRSAVVQGGRRAQPGQ